MANYYIWTAGCQMNVADSEQLAAQLEALGYARAGSPEAADMVVVNSCVVRQHAEDRVANKLNALNASKKVRPSQTIALMGCMVGPKTEDLRRRFPHVDVFMRPQDFGPLLETARTQAAAEGCLPAPVELPVNGPTAFVNIVHGCDNFCTFCIVPYRRGRERSRPLAEVVAEVEGLVARGVREVTLLGQKVDSYGHDLGPGLDLADLLTAVNRVDGLDRIRFLTSYPLGVTDKLIDRVARLEKVCEHINIPVQSGDDAVLAAMHRGYTSAQYRDRIARIKHGIPGVSLSTDIIVGFSGEDEAAFQRTMDLLEEVRFDVVHVAAYSVRPGTIAARTLADDVPDEAKKARLQRVEALQERVATELNGPLRQREVDVLVETRKDGRWEGRTRTNKLVHFPVDASDLRGEMARVKVVSTSPWSLQGELISAG
ncbi:MAG: tRNA (N6-isopentenyl adenosine(37)-C2)-methylthiotransferase MiaB [Dehalococcoidia bacterium]|nr:tRNA (N6-isopentenyl adenosine(37)-C2)-methylthiotransferase MiaB [Dehalococcoidia bacterium]